MVQTAPQAPIPSRRQRLEPVSVEPPGIRRPASVAPSTSHETTTFVHDPRRSARLGDKRRSSSNPDFAANSRGTRNNPADGTNPPKKNPCCVTTRRRNLRPRVGLRCRLGLAATRPLRRGVLGFRDLILPPPRLATCRLPAANFPLAGRIVAIPLVPSSGDKFTSTPLAQADPRPRSSDSGMTAAAWIIVVSAHGSVYFSQGKSGENAYDVLSGRSSKRGLHKESKSAPVLRTRR